MTIWGFVPWFVGLITSLLATQLTIKIFHKQGWVVDPTKTPHPGHIHKTPISKGGGLPVFAGFLIGSALFVTTDQYFVAIVVASLITLTVGLADDIWGLSPYFRLGANMTSALIIAGAGIAISFLSSPSGGVIDLAEYGISINFFGKLWEIQIAQLLTLIWIPLLMNAINFSSGVDGQASGVVSIAAFFLAITSIATINNPAGWPIFPVAMAISGAFAGLAWWHKYPQRIMPGYSATTLAGLWLGGLSVMSTSKLGMMMVVLAIPLADFVYLIVKRIKMGKMPVWGDKNHFHHFLLSIGWSKARVANFYWLTTATLGVISISLTTTGKIIALILVLLVMVLMRLWKKHI